jgi:hypothetical protein
LGELAVRGEQVLVVFPYTEETAVMLRQQVLFREAVVGAQLVPTQTARTAQQVV